MAASGVWNGAHWAILSGMALFFGEQDMTKGQKMRKALGPQPTGPAACWRSARIALVCCVCGGRSDVMHNPTRQHGVYCERHCVACNPALETPAARSAAIPLPDARGAVLAGAGARGGVFSKRVFGKRYEEYLEG